MKSLKKLKPRPCQICKVDFPPFNSLQVVCSPPCAIKKAQLDRSKAQKRLIRFERKDLRQRKRALKTASKWLSEAQDAFNKYIRYRDRDENCISCDRPEYEITEWLRGGIWDCGHYLTRGAHPELRFSELNGNKQCKSCNGGAGKYVKKGLTVTRVYRANLIVKIGLRAVEWLEGPHQAQNLTIPDIMEIKQYYKDQLKYIKQEEIL